MQTTLKVTGMSCGHCVKAITAALNALPGVTGAEADLKTGAVTVDHDPVRTPLEKIRSAFEAQGYDVE